MSRFLALLGHLSWGLEGIRSGFEGEELVTSFGACGVLEFWGGDVP